MFKDFLELVGYKFDRSHLPAYIVGFTLLASLITGIALLVTHFDLLRGLAGFSSNAVVPDPPPPSKSKSTEAEVFSNDENGDSQVPMQSLSTSAQASSTTTATDMTQQLSNDWATVGSRLQDWEKDSQLVVEDLRQLPNAHAAQYTALGQNPGPSWADLNRLMQTVDVPVVDEPSAAQLTRQSVSSATPTATATTWEALGASLAELEAQRQQVTDSYLPTDSPQ